MTRSMRDWVLGIDVGAESVKLVAIRREGEAFEVVLRRRVEHHKAPHAALRAAFAGVDLQRVASLATTGRLGRTLRAPTVPTKAALRRGLRALYPHLDAATVIGIGAHGFMVLEVRPDGGEVVPAELALLAGDRQLPLPARGAVRPDDRGGVRAL
jgi:activator of 2-hydroxyglutaryl-CoA dehydratase